MLPSRSRPSPGPVGFPMRVITLATQKGGSGKSTLAASLAVTAEANSLRVAVLDTDPQGSLFKWGERREAETPVVDQCEPHQLASVLKTLPAQGFDWACRKVLA